MSRLSQNFATVDQATAGILAYGAAPNGRVDVFSANPVFDLPDYQRKSVNNSDYHREAIIGSITANPVNEIFFSENNINILQDAIRYQIYVQTKGKYTIGRQSDQELKAVMRSIYFQYSVNQDTNCVGQVKVLNTYVLDWCVQDILSNLLQYQQYKVDISTLPIPLERSPLMSTSGTKNLELTSFM
jgi:Family of unknown function (DUF5761)